jgi:hypothetical protein
MFERIAEVFDGFSGYGMDTKPEPIEHNAYDGFMPFTNGGYRVMSMDDLSQCAGSGNIPKLIQPYIDSAQKDAAREFIRDSETITAAYEDAGEPDDAGAWLFKRWDDAEAAHAPTVPLFPELPPVAFWQTDIGAEREAFYEFEHTYLSEGGEFWYDARVHYYAKDNYRNTSGEDELYFLAGINTDFTYGRDKGLETLFERNIPLSQLTTELLADIEAEITSAVSGG